LYLCCGGLGRLTCPGESPGDQGYWMFLPSEVEGYYRCHIDFFNRCNKFIYVAAHGVVGAHEYGKMFLGDGQGKQLFKVIPLSQIPGEPQKYVITTRKARSKFLHVTKSKEGWLGSKVGDPQDAGHFVFELFN